MRPVGGGVQFFDLVEVDWRSDHGIAAAAETRSGCTDGATGDTCTAAPHVAARAGAGQPEARASATVPAMTGGRTTAIASVRSASDVAPAAWRIMVLES
jgi:hypothetical protein